MAMRLVDSATGIGSVHAGDLTLRATHYRLSFWANDDPQEATRGPAATTVDGHIDISGIGEAAVLSGPEALTLTLADGRQIAFRLKSSGGDIVGLCL
jgi:hypothetical protein